MNHNLVLTVENREKTTEQKAREFKKFAEIEAARAADRKRLAGEQFGENHPKKSDNVQIHALMKEQEHPVHEPEPLIDNGDSRD